MPQVYAFWMSPCLKPLCLVWMTLGLIQAQTKVTEIFCEGDAFDGVVLADQRTFGDIEDGEEGEVFDAAMDQHGNVVAAVNLGNDERAVILRTATGTRRVIVRSGDSFAYRGKTFELEAFGGASIADGQVLLSAGSNRGAVLLLGDEQETRILALRASGFTYGNGEITVHGEASITDPDAPFGDQYWWTGDHNGLSRGEKLTGQAVEGTSFPISSIDRILNVDHATGDFLCDAFLGTNDRFGGRALLHSIDGTFHALVASDHADVASNWLHERLAGDWAVFETQRHGDDDTVFAVYASRAGEVTRLAQSGDAVPGLPGYQWLQVADPQVTADGTVFFEGVMAFGDEVAEDFSNVRAGWWTWKDGQLSPLATAPQMVGDPEANEAVASFRLAGFQPVTVSPQGDLYYAIYGGEPFESPFELWSLDSEGTATKIATPGWRSVWPDEEQGFAYGGTIEGLRVDSNGGLLVDAVRTDGTRCLARIEPEREPMGELSLHRLAKAGLSPFSYGSSVAVDDPLVPDDRSSNLMSLFNLPVRKGMVADGVTPLLVRLTLPASLVKEPQRFRFNVRVVDGGRLSFGTLIGPGQFSTLNEDTGWKVSTVVDLSAENPVGHAFIPAIKPEDVRLDLGKTELTVLAEVFSENGDSLVATRTFALRKPPIFLIPDSPSEGWGEAFLNVLYESRPRDFVRQLPVWRWEDIKLRKPERVLDTTMLEWSENRADLLGDWAYTRPDVIAHGVGGVLARMIGDTGTKGIDDVNRGDFRGVTIGTSYGFSRINSYLGALSKKLDERESTRAFLSFIPQTIQRIPAWHDAEGAVRSGLVHYYGQFRDLGEPRNHFHSIATQILLTKDGDFPEPFLFTGMFGDRLELLSPFGIDGLTGVDEAAAHEGDRFTTVVAGHYGRSGLGFPRQTHAAAVARAAIDVLDGGPAVLTERKDLLELADSRDVSGFDRRLVDSALGELFSAGLVATMDRLANQDEDLAEERATFQLNPVPGVPVANKPIWIAEVYGPNGVTTEGVTVISDPNNHRVEVMIDDGVEGDVVLFASYRTPGGGVMFAEPQLVASRDSNTVPIEAIVVGPDELELTVGGTITPRLYVQRADGSEQQRWLTSEHVVVTSSNPQVVDASSPLRWQMVSPGVATLTVRYLGKTTTSTITVIDDPQEETPAPAGVLEPVIVEVEGASYPGVAFAGDSVSGAIEVSNDLRQWSTLLDLKANGSPLLNQNDPARWLLRDALPRSTEPRFFRLREGISPVPTAVTGTTELTFDLDGFGNFSNIDQGYGDRVTAVKMGNFNYAGSGGFTPNIEVQFGPEGADPAIWTTGYGDLENILFEDRDFFGQMEITFTADAGHLVSLQRWDMAAYTSAFSEAPTIDRLAVLDGDGAILYDETDLVVAIEGHDRYDFTQSPFEAPVIVLRFETGNLGGLSDDIAFDNILFGQK